MGLSGGEVVTQVGKFFDKVTGACNAWLYHQEVSIRKHISLGALKMGLHPLRVKR